MKPTPEQVLRFRDAVYFIDDDSELLHRLPLKLDKDTLDKVTDAIFEHFELAEMRGYIVDVNSDEYQRYQYEQGKKDNWSKDD